MRGKKKTELDLKEIAMMTEAIRHHVDIGGFSGVIRSLDLVVESVIKQRSTGVVRVIDYCFCRLARRTRIVLQAVMGAYWNDVSRSRSICMALRGNVVFKACSTERERHERDWRIFWST